MRETDTTCVSAVTPITVLLSRGNVSDSLLILLLVLAADATSAALLTGSLRQLLLAGVWVGLAFQAKMIQAWLALPRWPPPTCSPRPRRDCVPGARTWRWPRWSPPWSPSPG